MNLICLMAYASLSTWLVQKLRPRGMIFSSIIYKMLLNGQSWSSKKNIRATARWGEGGGGRLPRCPEPRRPGDSDRERRTPGHENGDIPSSLDPNWSHAEAFLHSVDMAHAQSAAPLGLLLSGCRNYDHIASSSSSSALHNPTAPGSSPPLPSSPLRSYRRRATRCGAAAGDSELAAQSLPSLCDRSRRACMAEIEGDWRRRRVSPPASGRGHGGRGALRPATP